jgi:hypothetical protein
MRQRSEVVMKHPWLYGLVMLCLALPAWASRTTVGNLELHAEAMPTTALTPEAAANYRVIPSAERGLLLVTVLKRERGHAVTIPAQVYAGAMNRNNLSISVPLREVNDGQAVYYLGEFRLTPPDELRFLVNANVLGTALKTEFSRKFPKD